jgi:hypothetical protein
VAEALTKQHRATLERLRERLRDAERSGDPIRFLELEGSTAGHFASLDRAREVREQIAALDAVLRATAGEVL